MKLLRHFGFTTNYYDLDARRTLNGVYIDNFVGWYKIIDDNICAIIVEKNFLYLIWKERKINILESKFSIILENVDSKILKNIKFFDSNKLEFQFNYEIEIIDELDSLLDWAWEQEDYDWGLYIKNIFDNKEKQNTLIENLR